MLTCEYIIRGTVEEFQKKKERERGSSAWGKEGHESKGIAAHNPLPNLTFHPTIRARADPPVGVLFDSLSDSCRPIPHRNSLFVHDRSRDPPLSLSRLFLS